MREWLDGLAGPGYTAALAWTLGALLLLVLVLLAIKVFRSLTFGTFVAGGRNRKTRLAVMDATAVDSHRRLVLVRRDDVEHLILIGGPTDVVVEQDIRMHVQQRRALQSPDHDNQPRQEHQRISEVVPAPANRPEPPRAQHPTAQVQRLPQRQVAPQPVRPATAAAPELRPAPARILPAPQATPAAPRPTPVVVAKQPDRDKLDETLAHNLEINLDKTPSASAPARPDMSLEDEMTKLLGELSSKR
ncbi:hypothetical protein GA830_15190 [Mesorhizobium sp. NBSH29]|uniref:flagellar biosynthetic protein FliO n=1 Tax=Mesorhizobium sp. NBSH29 TaxID=2654249 RepID=UPI001896900E|nr:flagellar biosynthetic protein FliO [Mesorhizobium sp. NBSH29]QPC87943.1 hypothetical protein GA830_15190 [Mesorhizobium sp. NBSH29]